MGGTARCVVVVVAALAGIGLPAQASPTQAGPAQASPTERAKATGVPAGTVAQAAPVRDVTPDCGGHNEAKCEFAGAVSHGKADRLGCRKGTFLDPRRGGECWSCPGGMVRTLEPVTAPKACGKTVVTGPFAKATFRGTVWGCGSGQFFDGVSGGSCWSCPANHNRSVHAVTGRLACTVEASLTCDAYLTPRGSQCVFTQEGQVKAAAERKAQEYLGVVNETFGLLWGVRANPALLQDLEAKSNAAKGRVEAMDPFRLLRDRIRGEQFRSITVGIAGGANAIVVGGALETGLAFSAVCPQGGCPAYWYGDASYKWGLALGGDLGVTIGVWKNEPYELQSTGHGAVLGINSLLGGVKDAKALYRFIALGAEGSELMKPGFGASVALWFNYDGGFEGITVTVSAGMGPDYGGYARSATLQLVGTREQVR